MWVAHADLIHALGYVQITRVMDAVRNSDGEMVVLKHISISVHPNEVQIGQFLCSPPVSENPMNHCCPILHVLEDPMNADIRILVMPLLRRYRDPAFETVGEAVEFFRQAFEVSSRGF